MAKRDIPIMLPMQGDFWQARYQPKFKSKLEKWLNERPLLIRQNQRELGRKKHLPDKRFK